MNFTALDAYLDSLLDFGLPMYDCTVHVGYKEVYRRRGGYIDVQSRRRHEAGTLYYLYSATKPVTCAALLHLMEQGAFALSDPVSRFLPEFGAVRLRGNRPVPVPITMEHLFTMTAGLNYDLETQAIQQAAAGGLAPTRKIVRAMAETPLSFVPGERWQYSLCHDVLCAVAEVITGEKFRDFVRRVIFSPLGMSDSFYGIPGEAENARMASLYRYSDESRTSRKIGRGCTFILGKEHDSGGAGMVSSAEDYIRFADALAAGGIGENGARILSPETVELMRENRLTPAAARSMDWPHLRGYGYGLGVRTMMDPAASGAKTPLGEFGWGGAAGAILIVEPRSRTAVYYAQHTLNPHHDKVLPELRDTVFACLQQ